MNRSRRQIARLATADDFRAFFGREPPNIWFGLTAERDGELIGMGVVRWDEWGRAWASFDAGEAVPPILMHRAARSAIDTLREVGEPAIYTFCDAAIPRAAAWLTRLGFAPDLTLSTPEAAVWSRRLNG